jgi:3-oxoacyl-[acyl-carrier protein] reductase
MSSEQAGKVAFVTGAARGFGLGFCHGLAAQGAAVAVVDIDAGAAEEAAQGLKAKGMTAMAVAADVSDRASVGAAVAAAAETFGGIDILVNNAGRHLTRYNRPFSEMPEEDLRDLFDVNVFGVIYCTTACSPYMKERGGGVVVNIGSTAAHNCPTPYGVSKLAVRGLTLAFAQELAPLHIRVNTISPGLIGTESALADLPAEMIEQFVNNLQLVRRLGSADDIVNALLYLCSDQASFVNGQTLSVNGGYPLAV